jgi:hypothetical protein
LPVDGSDGFWARETQQVVVALEGRALVVGEEVAPEILLFEVQTLDHGPHSTIQNEDTLR